MSDKTNIRSSDTLIYPGVSKQLASNKAPSRERKKHRDERNGSSSAQIHDLAAAANTSLQVESPKHPFELDWINLNQQEQFHDVSVNEESLPKINRSEQKTSSKLRREVEYPVSSSRNLGKKTAIMSGLPIINDSSSIELGGQLSNQPDEWFDDRDLDGHMADPSLEVKRTHEDDSNRLDEPIIQTLVRDLHGIYSKMKIIALPLSSYDIYKVVLRGWDLWGPLLLCTFLAFNLHDPNSKDSHSKPHFADVFVLVWFGSCLVSLNYRLLTISSMNSSAKVSSSTMLSERGDISINTSSLSLDSGETGVKHINQAHSDAKNHIARILMPPLDSPFKTLLSPPSIFQLMCVFGYCLVAPCLGVILLKIFSFNQLIFERVVVGLLLGFAWPTVCANRILIRYQHPEKRMLAAYPIALFYFVLSCMIILNH